MTGKITSIGIESGVIQAETSRNVSFDLSAVLTYDLAELAVGQSVTFDLRSGTHSKAINVVVQKQGQFSPSVKTGKPPCLRYMGFEQSGCTRVYSFEQIVPGEETKRFIVTADMGLFTRHRIGLQEGPALCLRSLTDELDAASATEPPGLRCSLSDQNMLAHLARRPAPKKSSRSKGILAASLHSV